MYYLLFGSVLPEFAKYLVIYIIQLSNNDVYVGRTRFVTGGSAV